ncbi:hypothetical protein BDW71DRAFT_209351 [Aspergillus fruticulosus]
MIQRSTTCVISSEEITDIGPNGLHDEQAPPAEDADMWFWGMPAEWLKSQQVGVTAIQNKHKETITGLEKSRFKRGGGCYIDVGASQLVIDGHIKIKQGAEIGEVQVYGLKFAGGTQLEADVIILAPGYQDMRTQTGDAYLVTKRRMMWETYGDLMIPALQIKAAEVGLS